MSKRAVLGHEESRAQPGALVNMPHDLSSTTVLLCD